MAFSGDGGPDLKGFLARPNFSAASGAGRNGVVLSHGFPGAGHKAGSPSSGFPELAVRLAAETGAVVVTFDFRGHGPVGRGVLTGRLASRPERGHRHPAGCPGHREDVACRLRRRGDAVHLRRRRGPLDRRCGGLFPLADFAERAGETRRSSAQARAAAGAARTRGYPPEPGTWARDVKEVRPSLLVANIPPRPLLIVHGASDDVVPITDARELADAADASSELRILAGAGHGLVHDPRAIALLLGWFDRHLGSVA